MQFEYGFPNIRSVINLTFAVHPTDDFTGIEPLGNLSVGIEKVGIEGTKNDCGYYLFLDLNDEREITISVQSEFGYYFDYKQTIDLSVLNQDPAFKKNPVIEVSLLPNTSYPFASNTTLVKGLITSSINNAINDATVVTDSINDITKNAVGNAEVKIVERNLIFSTDIRGDYVFYLKNLRKEDILKEVDTDGNTKNFIRMGAGAEFTLTVDHPNFLKFQKDNYRVEEGKQEIIDVSLEPR